MSIAADRYYAAEVVPPALRELARGLVAHFRIAPGNVGLRGNPETHRRGYHRSRAFLTRSPLSGDDRYTVTDAPGNAGGDPNWVCGLDLTLPRHQLLAVCRRLDVAVRAGRLPQVAEWYGNTDGDNRVDGWDNIRGAIATSDDSHLWHLHLGLIRARAGDDHAELLAVLTGNDTPMTPAEFVALLRTEAVKVELQNIVKEARFDLPPGGGPGRWTIGGALTELLKRPQLEATPPGSLDPTALGRLADDLWHRFVTALTPR